MSKPIKGRIYQPYPGSCLFYEVPCDKATYNVLVECGAKAMWRTQRDATAPNTAFLATQWKQLPKWGRARYRAQVRAAFMEIGLVPSGV